MTAWLLSQVGTPAPTGCVPSAGGYKCAHDVHVHQYDDKYNVTGVDMQNSSIATVNLKNAITVPTTPTTGRPHSEGVITPCGLPMM